MHIQQIQGIAQVDSKTWNSLTGISYPFLRHEFLSALEQSGSVCPETGWQPAHLLVFEGVEIVAVMPLYLKRHSWGEYVFDQQWAQAYAQAGLAYYPKYLTAIPLTPCQGSRIAVSDDTNLQAVSQLILDFIQDQAEQQDLSSWHCLFPTQTELNMLRSLGLQIRLGVQFQWFNRDYRDFDGFLQALNAGKRKMIKRERRRITEQGVSLLRVAGTEVSAAQWQAFFKFYEMTYLKHGTQAYLNLAFFQQLATTMAEQLLLVLAVKDGNYVAAALSFIGTDTLYGRYWGCYDEYHSLHFETCYYQGIEFCIGQGLGRFDSGAQGEHKIARGFEPVMTYSAHWLKDQKFANAVAQFLSRESKSVLAYKDDAGNYLPFKKEGS